MGRATITGFGACGEVGRSCFLLRLGRSGVLLDCGMGLDERPPAIDAAAAALADLLVLSHAHPDHTGYVPQLCLDGFTGSILATRATWRMATTLWEERSPAGTDPAAWCRGIAMARDRWCEVSVGDALRRDDLVLSFRPAGHLLGSMMTEIRWRSHRVLYTGDIGFDPFQESPCDLGAPGEADTIVCESTCAGTARPDRTEAIHDLVRQVGASLAQGGSAIVTSFGYGRTQQILVALLAAGVPPSAVVVDRRVDTANRLFAGLPGAEVLARCPPHLLPADDAARVELLEELGQVVAVVATDGPDGAAGWLIDRLGSSALNLLAISGFVAAHTAVAAAAGGQRAVRVSRFHVGDHADGPQLRHALREAAGTSIFCVHGAPEQSMALRDIAANVGYEHAVVPTELHEYALWPAGERR